MFKKTFLMIALLVLTAFTIFNSNEVEAGVSNALPAEDNCESCGDSRLERTTFAIVDELRAKFSDAVAILPFKLSKSASTDYPYVLQPGTPTHRDNFANPDDGCEWQGVAGQVFDEMGDPVFDLQVRVVGWWGLKRIDITQRTGSEEGNPYGPGGYEIFIGPKAKDTVGTLKVRLYDDAGQELARRFYFDTYKDCAKNLTVINFIPASVIDDWVEPTPTPEVEPTKTVTAIPPTATNTATVVQPTVTQTPVPTEPLVLSEYNLQSSSPVYLTNFAHPDAGCSWQGVAGQVFGVDGNPVNNIAVKVSGSWNGKTISLVGVTGVVAGLPYGPGSYEIELGSVSFDSIGNLEIQLFSMENKPLSLPVTFNTYADCSKNLVIINFKLN